LKSERKLYIPTGNYLVSDLQLPANNFRIYGDGAFSEGGSRLLLKEGGKRIFFYNGQTQCHSLTFNGLVFDGNKTGSGILLFGKNTNPIHGAFNISVSNVRFVDCTYGFYSVKIFASEWRRITIDGCTLGGIVGLTGPSNILQSITIQSVPRGAVGIHVYNNNTHIIGLTAAKTRGPSLVVGRSKPKDARNGVAWVKLESSHFEDFTSIPLEVRGGSRISIEDTEFFASAGKHIISAYIHIDYANRPLWMNNVRFHSKGSIVKFDVQAVYSTESFEVVEMPGVRLRPTRIDKGKMVASKNNIYGSPH